MKSEKELLKNEIKGKITHFASFAIMQYMGLKANVANELRREVGKLGGDVEMVRKRVLLKAAEDVGLQLDLAALPGHIGIVFFGDEPLEAAKMVFKFSYDRDKAIKVIGGRFEGQLYTGPDVERLSTLPGKDGMRAQLLSVLEAPLAQTVAVMEALLMNVPYCLENKSKQ